MGNLRRLTVAAFMSALSVVLTRFASVRIAIGGVEGIRLGLGALPNIVAGILLGPLYGALSGAVADVAGFTISPMGGYLPHFTLTAALTGTIPGVVVLAFRRRRKEDPSLVVLGLAVAAGTALVGWGLTPYFLHTLFGMDYRVIMPPRLVAGLLEIPAYSLVVRAVCGGTAGLASRTGGAAPPRGDRRRSPGLSESRTPSSPDGSDA